MKEPSEKEIRDMVFDIFCHAIGKDYGHNKLGLSPHTVTIKLKEEDDDIGKIGEHYVVKYLDAALSPHTAYVRADAVKRALTKDVILEKFPVWPL